jgi:3-oxoacyl-[acyl-carrier protein] reductase
MINSDLKGKVVLITGASRGIGRHIAIEMSKVGASVAINYMEDEIGIDKTLELIREIGGYGKKYRCDLRDFLRVKQMIKSIISDFGQIDVLINNAGVSKIGLFVDSNEEEYNYIMDSNFKSVYNCTNAVISHMILRKCGSIINISSIWGNVGASCETLYSASKGAINAFTMALGKELATANIRVNAIAPGVIDTDMNRSFSHEEIDSIKEDIPMDRLGKPKEIGELAVFLASNSSSYITSQIITIDGGFL